MSDLFLGFAIYGFANELSGFWVIAIAVKALPSFICSFANRTTPVCFLCCHDFLTFRMYFGTNVYSLYRAYHSTALNELQFYPPYPSAKERELSPKTVRNIHGVLHRTLEQAKLLGYIKVNPADAAVTPRVEKKQVEAMDVDDIGKFLAAIQGSKYEYPMFVAVFTGLRQGELLGLTWDCVDFENGLLLINKQHNRVKGDTEFRFASLKNDKARVLTAADEVMEVLRLQKQRQNAWAAALGDGWSNPDNLVFTTEFGRYINNKILYQNFKRIMRKLGKPNLRFHDLRHTYAVNSLRAGDDIKTVQENLGHATASFTLATYAHATPGMKRESAKRMTEFIRSVQGA